MDDQGRPIEIEEAQVRRLLQHAADDIGRSEPRRAKHRRAGRSAAVIPVAVFALAASAGTGFAFGRGAPASGVRLASLPSQPPLVEAALQQMFGQRDPQIVQRVDSVDVKYVTDEEFWHAVSSAWKTGNPAACGTFSGPSGAIGHWYVVDLHGKFIASSGPGIATKYVSVAVVMVPASDLQAYVSSLPAPRVPATESGWGASSGPIAPPAPSGARTNISSNFGFPPVGADGQPLCWSSLPSGSYQRPTSRP